MKRLGMVTVLICLGIVLALPPVQSMAHTLCFPADKTPYCYADPFSDYWEQNGGLPVFGYPITEARQEYNRDLDRMFLTQWAERNRFEDHPENTNTPYRILLGRLGVERLAQLGRDPQLEGRESGPKAGCRWFAETGHNVCNMESGLGFKTYWESHGLKIPGLDDYNRSLQLFGFPLTEPRIETNTSGHTVLTQWFERARFEWHPDNPNEFKVLLGLLGREVLLQSPIPTATPPTNPAPTNTPRPPANATATVVGPSPTVTSVPPTVTSVPPTVTSIPPTSTPRPYPYPYPRP